MEKYDPEALNQAMADVDFILERVREEIRHALIKHRAYASAHEAWAVMKEELDELWEEVRADNGYTRDAFKEAEQVACTAVRYILHLHGRMEQ